MLLFNFLITALCLWIVYKLNSKFLVPAKMNEYRFRIFALRDKLAMMAMRSEISASDKQYKILMKMINTTICVLGKFSAVDYLKYLAKCSANPEIKRDAELFIKSFEEHPNKGIAQIASEFFQINRKLLHKHTRVMHFTLVPFLTFVMFPFLKFIIKIVEVFDKQYQPTMAITAVQNRIDLIDNLDHEFEQKLNRLKLAAA